MKTDLQPVFSTRYSTIGLFDSRGPALICKYSTVSGGLGQFTDNGDGSQKTVGEQHNHNTWQGQTGAFGDGTQPPAYLSDWDTSFSFQTVMELN